MRSWLDFVLDALTAFALWYIDDEKEARDGNANVQKKSNGNEIQSYGWLTRAFPPDANE